jgi:hypothetical protein
MNFLAYLLYIVFYTWFNGESFAEVYTLIFAFETSAHCYAYQINTSIMEHFK